MTKAQFIASVEAKPNFIKWVKEPALAEACGGGIEKWNGVAYITTQEGANVFNVWFMWDSALDDAKWQNTDTMEPNKALEFTEYLDANFDAYFVLRQDWKNRWTEADVFVADDVGRAKKTVLVYREDGSVTHEFLR